MPKTFAELMEQFRNPGDTGLPDTFVAELEESFSEEISIRDAAIADREEKITAAEQAKTDSDAEIIRLKAVNYDLIKAAPKTAGSPAEDNKPDGGADTGGVDSLFE